MKMIFKRTMGNSVWLGRYWYVSSPWEECWLSMCWTEGWGDSSIFDIEI